MLSVAVLFCILGFTFAFEGHGWVVFAVPPMLALAAYNMAPLKAGLIFGLFSLCAWLGVASWLPQGINAMNPSYPILGYLTLFVLALGSAVPYFFFGLFAARQGWFGRLNSRPVAAAALLCLLVELWPARLPGSLGMALFRHTLVVQIVELGGTGLLTFVVYACGFLMFKAVVIDHDFRGRLVSLSLCTTIGGASLAYGYVQHNYWGSFISSTPAIRIAMVQPNLPIEDYETPGSKDNSIESLSALTRELIQQSVKPDLVVWPEIPIFFSPRNSQSAEDVINSLLLGTTVPLLANADSYPEETLYGRTPFYNTVQLFRGDGKVSQEYQKMILVPFGEYLPFESWLTHPALFEVLRDVRRYVPGNELNLIHLTNQVKLGTPICLEAHHTELIGDMVRRGANVLINPANDAYFGTSKGAYVDFALTVFRAVEYRIPLVRVSNSGISAAVDQRGEIDESSLMPQFAAEKRTFEVVPSSRSGMFAPKIRGNIFFAFIILMALARGLLWRKSLEFFAPQ